MQTLMAMATWIASMSVLMIQTSGHTAFVDAALLKQTLMGMARPIVMIIALLTLITTVIS
jgi:hypothetical protein